MLFVTDYDDQEASRLIWTSSGRANLSEVHVDNIVLAKQNSNEEGVFISQDTLEDSGQRRRRVTERNHDAHEGEYDAHEGEHDAQDLNARRVMQGEYDALDLNARILLGPTQIRTFVVQLVSKETTIEKFVKSAPRSSGTSRAVRSSGT
jgi:hypothetical protein